MCYTRTLIASNEKKTHINIFKWFLYKYKYKQHNIILGNSLILYSQSISKTQKAKLLSQNMAQKKTHPIVKPILYLLHYESISTIIRNTGTTGHSRQLPL